MKRERAGRTNRKGAHSRFARQFVRETVGQACVARRPCNVMHIASVHRRVLQETGDVPPPARLFFRMFREVAQQEVGVVLGEDAAKGNVSELARLSFDARLV